ncbi:MAG TPA: Rieske 2Fe-2S domain-containing protein [Candidatus Binataceae bacterium]|nr:Rieske 2Fe-2S domain-containing protein [Candidatus Binataceae bacterium]
MSPRRRHLGPALPAEGDNGLFSESWFPICLSRELPAGKVIGADFLDGRVVAFRGESGTAQVMSAYCAHLGADLSVGDVQGDTLRCAFHHWRYDADGICVATKVGDPPPPAACLFKFPTCERHGIVFAYNGERPRFEFPDFPFPDSQLLINVSQIPDIVPTDPWVLSCNTPDMQHIKALHGITFDQEDPHDSVEWTDHSMLYDLRGRHAKGEPIEYRVGIFGNNIYYQSGTIEGRWFGMMTPFSLPKPGHTQVFAIIAVRKDEGDAASNKEFLRAVTELEMRVVGEDLPIVNGIHFRPGTLTKSDRTLARFFQYLREYPRCHPSAEFIV